MLEQESKSDHQNDPAVVPTQQKTYTAFAIGLRKSHQHDRKKERTREGSFGAVFRDARYGSGRFLYCRVVDDHHPQAQVTVRGTVRSLDWLI